MAWLGKPSIGAGPQSTTGNQLVEDFAPLIRIVPFDSEHLEGSATSLDSAPLGHRTVSPDVDPSMNFESTMENFDSVVTVL